MSPAAGGEGLVPRRTTAAASTALLLVLGLATPLAWRAGLDLWGALGTDAAMWGLSAEGLRHGAASAVPPAWPVGVVALRALGLGLPAAGTVLSMALGALVPAAVFQAARSLGATTGAALAAGLGVLLLPDLCAWSNEAQGNSALALAMVALTGLWGRVLRQASPGRLGLLAAVLTGLLPLVRETGVVGALAAIVVLPLLRPGGWRLSLVVLLVWWGSPLLVGALPGATPLRPPWSDRGGMALAGLAPGDGPLPNYVAEVPPDQRARYVGWLREGATLQIAAWHAARSLRIAADGWLVAGGALLALISVRRRRALLAALLPLSTLAPALLLWTQRRHVLLAVPALLAVAAATPGASRRRALPALLAAGGLLLALPRWPDLAEEQRGSTARARTLAELGAFICEGATPGPARLLAGPIQDVGLYCPLPRHDPDGSSADALTALVLPDRARGGLLPPGWQAHGPRHADLRVYRSPDAAVPACPDGVPERGTPYLSTGPTHAALVGCPETE